MPVAFGRLDMADTSKSDMLIARLENYLVALEQAGHTVEYDGTVMDRYRAIRRVPYGGEFRVRVDGVEQVISAADLVDEERLP